MLGGRRETRITRAFVDGVAWRRLHAGIALVPAGFSFAFQRGTEGVYLRDAVP